MSETIREILAEARADVAAGREPDARELGSRIRAAAEPGRDAEKALQQLERVLTVARARARLAEQPAPRPTAPVSARRRAMLRTRPTVTANMDVRRAPPEQPTLAWPPAPQVVEWEVRFSERPDGRSDYVVREELALPGTATTLELPLADRPFRVHLLGRARDGRLLRRAIVSGLTRETWKDKWERRASAS